MTSPTRIDPREYCIRCWHSYGFSDESCTNCGFDPVDDEQDEEEQAKAEREWDLRHD